MWKTTASFDGKYEKNVRGATSAAVSDVRDRRGLVAALGEEAHGRLDDLLARPLLLAFPQSLGHVSMVANMHDV